MADTVIRGQFDVSDIMSSLNTLYAEIKKNNKTPLLDNVDKEVKAIERLALTLLALATKGFANDKEFKAYESNLNKLETMVIKVGLSFDRVNTKNLEIELKNIKDNMKNLKEEADKLTQSFSLTLNGKFTSSKGIDFKEVNKGIAEAAAQGRDFAEALKLMKNYYDKLAESATKSIFNGNDDKFNAYKNNLAYAPGTGLRTNMFTNISGKMSEHQELRNTFVEIAKQGKTAEESVKAFNQAIAQFGTQIKNPEKMGQLFTEYAQKIKDYGNLVLQAKLIEKEYSEERNKNLALLAGTEQSYRAALAAGIKLQNQSADAELRARDAYNQTALAITNTNRANLQYIDTARRSAEETKLAVTALTLLNNTLDRLKSRITYVLSLTNVYYQLRRVLTLTLNDVNNIDKAFASIAMVTEKTINGLWEHYGEYAQLAQKLGQSTESAIKTSALFYQLGLKDAEVMRLTEDTMKLATLAGLDFEKATSLMTAALRGFHMEMENSSHVTDVYSELAAHAAADVNGIAYAMSKTASIANNAGMSFENTAAFLTLMIETTLEAPENIGTALKTIIARFTELKENVAGTADSEFEDLDYNKVDKALKTVGVSLKDASGLFRNLDEVFLELSSKWDTLDRNSQRYIATIAAGSRQLSRFIAMMEDYDRTLELVSVTEDAKGRADELFAKNAESLQFKLLSLKTAWELLRLSFANSDFFKGVVDMMTKFVNILGKMDKTLMATVATIGIVMGKTIITNLLDTIKLGASLILTTLLQVSDIPFWKRNPLLPFRAVFNRPFDSEKYMEGSHATLGNALGVSQGFDPSKISAENLTSLELLITKVAQLNQSYLLQWNTIKLIEAAGGTITGKQETQILLTNQLLLAAKELANAKAKELGYEREITQENSKLISLDLQSVRLNSTSTSMGGQLIKRGLQSGLLAGITTALMTALSGADFSTVIKTTLTTALMATLPSVITAISEPLITALAGPAGLIALIVIAIGVGVANIIKKQNEARDAEMERLGLVKKLNKELLDQAEELINENKKNLEEAKKLRKYREDIEKYLNKNPEFLTDEELKRLTEAQDYIKDNYEDAFRETWDGKFELIEKKLDLIILKMDNDGAPGKLLANINLLTKNLNDRAEELERYLNVISGKGGFSKDNFLRIGTNWDLLFDRNFKDTAKMAGGYLIDGENAINIGTELQILDNIERLYGEEIPQEYSELFDNFSGTQEEINQIISLIEDLKIIEAAQLDETLRLGVLNILELLGWDKGAAEIASYLGAEIKENGNEEFAKAIEHNLVETLSSGQYSKLGANEETVLTALESLGIESPQDLFDSGSNLKKWDALAKESKDFVAALESMGITKDTWDNGNAWLAIALPGFIGAEFGRSLSGLDSIIRAGRKDANMENRVLSLIIAALTLKDDDLFTKKYKEAFEKNLELFTAYYAAEMDYAGKTFKEFSDNLDAIYNSTDDKEVKDAITAYNEKHKDSVKGQWERYNNILETSGIDEGTIEQLSFNSAQNIQSLIMSVSSASRDLIVEYLNGLGESLSTKDWEILGNLNLKDLSSLGIDGAQTYVDLLIAAGHSAEEALKIFNDYIQKMSRFTLQGLYFGADSTNILHENIKEKISGLPELFESITKAQKEMMENGFIAQETYLKLREDGMDEYVTYTSNGYELISDKAQEFFVKLAMSSKEFVSQEIKNLKEYANELSEISKQEEEKINRGILHILTLKPEEIEGQLQLYYGYYGTEVAATIEAIYRAGAKNLTEYRKLIKEGILALTEEEKQAYLDGLIAINELYKEAADNVEKLKDDLDELNKTLEKNKETLDEAELKYQEAIHGSQYFTSSLDPLLNYDNTLKSINNDLDDLKESFEDIDSIEDGVDILNDLADNYDKKSATLSSENVIYGNAMANLRASMEDRFGNYIKFNGDNLFVDYSYTLMDANDAIRKALEESINTYNSYKDKRQNNDKELRKLDKERLLFEKDALKEYVDLQKEVIDVLKSQAEEEVTVTKDKYDALKEADNEYIDALEEAILKLRDLRNKENEEEELALKEKRLSLMRRDTSGTNAKEIQSLEQEIESDREKLLDNSIDSIVNNMKELYEKQAEARDAEIEYMEAVTENAQYFSDWAASIMASWNSLEDMQAWFLDNDKTVEDMTIELQELYISDLKEKWTDLVTYLSTLLVDVNANMDNINLTMNNLLTDLDENATTKGQEIITIALHTADEAIKSAEKARDSAKEAIEETEKKIVELNKNMATATEVAQLTHGAAMKAMKDASQEAMRDTSVYAVKVLADFLGVDLKDETATKAFAEKNDLVNARGEYSLSLLDAIWLAGGSTKNFKSTESWMMYLPGTGSSQETVLSRGYATQTEAEAAARAYGSNAKVRLDVTSGKYGNISDFEYNSNPISFSNPSSKSEAKLQFSIKDYLARTPMYPGLNGNAIITFADGTWGYLNGDALEKVGYNIYSLLNYPDVTDVSWGWDLGKATYKKGGLVKHTGPAWVDGTSSRPEAFLSAEDTERFSLAAELFATSPLLNSKMAQNNISSSIGDTSIEININVESISDDYDVDRLILRVEDDINETARPIGTQVILNKRV